MSAPTSYGDVYTNSADIQTPFGIGRIGIAISERYQLGLHDIEIHYPEIVSGGGGRSTIALAWQAEAKAATATVISKIDEAIAELQTHRDRLVKEIDLI